MSAFYMRWIWANAWSELVGLGGTFAFGFLLFSGLDQTSVSATLAGVAFAIVAGAMLEGGVVGWAQARVIRARVPDFSYRRWIWATVIGAGTAWLLGMIPSTLMSLRDPGADSTPTPEPGTGALLLLAAALGVILGPVLSLPQYFVLKPIVDRASRWILANAFAWAIGMVVIFAGIGTLPGAPGALRVGVTVSLSCLSAGALVGAVHGRTLLRLTERPDESSG